jgi:serine/threonine-protein kinase
LVPEDKNKGDWIPEETTPLTPSQGLPPDTDSSSRHGRFLPGTSFGKRYRIVGLLGKGGMGEVYQADDLELGQTVALKLLPQRLSGDEAALTLLRNEVRVARQISHPNVCRVYDIGEVDDQYFVSMEYVDGEDLASLLRRIGRVSSEKALDIIRQLAAGLAAAHDLGVLHRDFKPANIMIDGRGHVRIMDFGLAGFVEEIRGDKGFAGTIGYMSPEQLAGQGATMRSDVYSLGLVMYETLTGRKPYDARTLEGLRDLQAAGPPSAPSEYVSELEPAISDLVMWCLERDPAKRPSSARAAASAMPGMDPLAAAMAAGETPSVEMVAAAGGHGGLTTGTGSVILAIIIIGFITISMLNDHAGLFRLAPLPEPPVYLSRQARKVLSDIGLEGQPADEAHGYLSDQELLTYIQENDSLPDRWNNLRAGRRSVYHYWYRESPWPLVPLGITRGRVSTEDPPPLSPGMAEVWMDAHGRLTKLQVVRPLESEHYLSSAATNWSPLFSAAAIDTALLEQVEKESWDLTYRDNPMSAPRLRFHVLADEMVAWEGTHSEDSEDRITVWAAAYRGLPVYFNVTTEYGAPADSAVVEVAGAAGEEVEPATGEEARENDTARTLGMIFAWVFGIGALLLMLLPIALMARAQLRAGRGDRRGAYRFGMLLLPLLMIDWLFAAHHTTDPSAEILLFVTSLGMALFGGIFFGAAYLALEPYMRKYWPDGLISWARLIGGKYRDPIVGRDVLLGAAAGVLLKVLWQFRFLVPKWLGAAPARPANILLETINGIGPAIAEFFSPSFMIIPLIGVIGLVLLRILLRRRGVAVTVFAVIVIVIPVLIILVSSDDAAVVGSVTALAWIVTVLGVSFIFVKLGLLATIAMFFFFVKLENFPITLDSSAWYMGTSTAVLFALGALALWAFINAITRSSRIQNQP